MNEKIAEILSEYVIHCDTEKKARELLRILDRFGCNWLSGERLLSSSDWEIFREATYYKVFTKGENKGCVVYGSVKDEGLRVLNIMAFSKFKTLLNMEKEIKIQVPEGYEIDEKNSTFECIKFKPIKKVETYDDVARELFLNKNAYFIDTRGRVSNVIPKNDYNDFNNCVTKKQAEKLLAINQLMNVAHYLNKDWKPDWNNHYQNKFYIFVRDGVANIDYVLAASDGAIVFPDRETAKRAIEILGEETIRLALGDY